MASFDIIMPKMGESIEEATITKWFVKEGDKVEEDDLLLEIATDKVDSEIPSPVEGLVKKILFRQDEVVAVGAVIAVIGLDGDDSPQSEEEAVAPAVQEESSPEPELSSEAEPAENVVSSTGRFYSPLVKTIASAENITQAELDTIVGSGINGRVQKNDLLKFLENRSSGKAHTKPAESHAPAPPVISSSVQESPQATQTVSAPVSSGEDEIIEMSRLRKLIADHMIKSKQTSAHVTNMIEVDVTGVVN